MHILGETIIQQFSDAKLGELVAFGSARRNMGFILAQDANWTRIGVLETDDEPHPFALSANPRDNCISFGTDWLIEPEHGASSFPSVQHENQRLSGLMAQTKDGWMMSLAASGVDQHGRFSLEWWHLDDLRPVDRRPEVVAVFASWTIWSSAEARADMRAVPVFRYTASKPALRQ